MNVVGIYRKRLSERILTAFNQACDQCEIAVAWDLLDVLQCLERRRPTLPTGEQRKVREELVAAHERLWPLRFPDEVGGV